MGLFSKKKEELPPLKLDEEELPSYKGIEEEIKGGVFDDVSVPEQPLFVRIEKYKEVLETLKRLREKISDAEEGIAKIENLRHEEEKELEAWSNDLNAIRQQLLAIDKKLFE